jgi:hypothetical protein
MIVSFKAQSIANSNVYCEGHTMISMKGPFTYDDLVDCLYNAAKAGNNDEWKKPIIVSLSEISKGLYEQLSKRREEE